MSWWITREVAQWLCLLLKTLATSPISATAELFSHCSFERTLYRKGGSQTRGLTVDHKPSALSERQRITAAGGQIYQTTTQLTGKKDLVGPYRVRPGGLSVSRAVGDPVAKLPACGGNPKVVVATPDIISFKVTSEHDFVVIGSDGIFDQLSNEDVVQCVWNSTVQEKTANIHQQCGAAVDCIMKNALARRSLDNISAAVIAFRHFKMLVFPETREYAGAEKEQNSVRYGREYSKGEYKQSLGTVNLNAVYPQSTREAFKNPKFGFEFKELHKKYNL
eukprot:TRINITY_DN10533_c0_g1_i6.p2 TRINITY_DN10533_c0_g1~~TRINITY_DN10533_c0_g1_i6.p2  ORF type:complete len:277 (-),score=57.92 TRINITY_DN10533_c0_g1_i6:154-984(-)